SRFSWHDLSPCSCSLIFALRAESCSSPRFLFCEHDRKQNAGAIMTPALHLCRSSGRLQIGRGGFAAAAVGLDVERQLLALDQRAHAGALDRRDVHEDVGAAGVLHDEAVALLGVEELDGTLSHDGPPLENADAFLWPREPFTRSKSGFCVVLG